jgi:hypothetical protein
MSNESEEDKRIASMEKEREDLRTDIRQNNNIMHGLLYVLFVGVSAVAAFAFTSNNPLGFVAIFNYHSCRGKNKFIASGQYAHSKLH